VTTTPTTWRQHLRAVAVLTAGFTLLMLGMPGVSFIKRGTYKGAKQRAEALERMGVLAHLAFAAADFNRDWRIPFEHKVGRVQRPFRISQTFHLYRDGPSKVRRLEVWADDRLLHRSGDEEEPWRDAQLRNRRFRPIVEASVRKATSPNAHSMARWIVGEVQEHYPTVSRVEVRAVWSRFPGTGEQTLHHGWYADAPHWTVYRLPDTP